MPNGAYFLTRYDDLVTAYKNTKTFSSDKKEFAGNTATRCSSSTTPRASSSTIRRRTPACGG